MLLQVDAGVLVALAVALAGPVPVALAQASWPARSPRAALVLWQAVGLGGGLGILGSGLTLAAASLSHSWLGGIAALLTGWSRLGLLGWAGVAMTVTVGMWLVAVTAASSARVVVARRAHRDRLDAVADILRRPHDCCRLGAEPAPQVALAAIAGLAGPARSESGWRQAAEPQPCSDCVMGPACLLAGVHLLDHPTAVAYCLPGLRPRIVVSSGALQTLDGDELAAVLTHERAHARGHYDLVVQPFVAWQQTFSFLPAAATALATVDLLVEMLADDAARQSCPPQHLRTALSQMGAARPGDHYLATQITARRTRLAIPPRPLPRSVRILLYLASAAVVLAPPTVLLLS